MDFSSIKNHIGKYGLVMLGNISLVSASYTLYQHAKRLNELEKSDYIFIYRESRGSLYGYDDNKDGLVDRIEGEGITLTKVGIPALRIGRTHLPSDSDYQWYSLRLVILGKPRN